MCKKIDLKCKAIFKMKLKHTGQTSGLRPVKMATLSTTLVPLQQPHEPYAAPQANPAQHSVHSTCSHTDPGQAEQSPQQRSVGSGPTACLRPSALQHQGPHPLLSLVWELSQAHLFNSVICDSALRRRAAEGFTAVLKHTVPSLPALHSFYYLTLPASFSSPVFKGTMERFTPQVSSKEPRVLQPNNGQLTHTSG